MTQYRVSFRDNAGREHRGTVQADEPSRAIASAVALLWGENAYWRGQAHIGYVHNGASTIMYACECEEL